MVNLDSDEMRIKDIPGASVRATALFWSLGSSILLLSEGIWEGK